MVAVVNLVIGAARKTGILIHKILIRAQDRELRERVKMYFGTFILLIKRYHIFFLAVSTIFHSIRSHDA